MAASSTPDYRRVNPQELIPALVHDGHLFAPVARDHRISRRDRAEPPLLPKGRIGRARARADRHAIACDIHPVNNLRVQQYLRGEYGQNEEVIAGLAAALDRVQLRRAGEDAVDVTDTGNFCHGDTPTLADICLIPQMANARRAKMDVRLADPARIEQTALAHPAFDRALPANQPDAE